MQISDSTESVLGSEDVRAAQQPASFAHQHLRGATAAAQYETAAAEGQLAVASGQSGHLTGSSALSGRQPGPLPLAARRRHPATPLQLPASGTHQPRHVQRRRDERLSETDGRLPGQQQIPAVRQRLHRTGGDAAGGMPRRRLARIARIAPAVPGHHRMTSTQSRSHQSPPDHIRRPTPAQLASPPLSILIHNQQLHYIEFNSFLVLLIV